MIAAEGLAAVGCMIAAYRRSDGAATYYKIAWVTVALRDLEGHGRCLGPDGFRASAVVDRCGPAGAARVRGGARIPARFGEVLLGTGHGAMRYLPPIYPLTLYHQPRRRPHRTAAG